MGAKRTEYQIVGRYMSGKNVTGYHLQSIETGKSGRYTKEQVCYLVGRDQVTNCTGQIYNDTVLLRGKGMSLDDLPVQYDDGDTRNMDRVGKIRKGTDASAAMEQFLIVGTIKSGRSTVGYVIQNAGCGIKKVKRQQVIELAAAGKIGNARVQNYQGKILLRGVGCNLDELPSEVIEAPNTTVTDKTNTTPSDNKIAKAKKYPEYVNNLLAVFNHIAPKLKLEKCDTFLTNDGDGRYRIDFSTTVNSAAVLFINIDSSEITGCYHDYDNEIEEEKNIHSSNMEAIKSIFVFYSKCIAKYC